MAIEAMSHPFWLLLCLSSLGLQELSDILLAVGVLIKPLGAVQRRPLGLFLEQTHSLDILLHSKWYVSPPSPKI